MPGYKGHLAGGLVVYGVLLFALRSLQPNVLVMFEWLVFALCGSLFPDVDIKSKGQPWFYRIILVALILLVLSRRYLPAFIVSLFALIPLIGKHRGVLHRWWFVVGITLSLVVTVSNCTPCYSTAACFDGLFFACGALSHIYLDVGLVRTFRF